MRFWLLVQFWHANGWPRHSRYIRCSSVVVLHRFNCFEIGWDVSRLDRVDRCLMDLLGGQLTHPSQLEQLCDVRDMSAWYFP